MGNSNSFRLILHATFLHYHVPSMIEVPGLLMLVVTLSRFLLRTDSVHVIFQLLYGEEITFFT